MFEEGKAGQGGRLAEERADEPGTNRATK